MTADVTLRAATVADAAVVAAIWHASASLPTVGPPIMPSEAELLARAEANFARGWAVTLAERDGAALAFLALRPEEGILDELFVRPDSLGLGLGTVLLERAKAAMPDGFSLFTAASNSRARRFYEKGGMRMLRDAPHPRTGHPVIYYGWKEAGPAS